jgi:hypothetical protein
VLPLLLLAVLAGGATAVDQPRDPSPSDLHYIVHAIIRVPDALPEPGATLPESSYTVRHVTSAPLYPAQAYELLWEWQEYSVPHDRAHYPAVRTWMTKNDTGDLVASGPCLTGCTEGQPCYTLVLRYTLWVPGGPMRRPMPLALETFTAENYPGLEAAACGERQIRRNGYRVLLPPEVHGGVEGNVMPETITPLPVL